MFNTFIRLLKLIPRVWRPQRRHLERKENLAQYKAICNKRQEDINQAVSEADRDIIAINRKLHSIDMVTACHNN